MRMINMMGILACSLMALCLPMSVYAEEYDISDGNITVMVNANETQVYVGDTIVDTNPAGIVLMGQNTNNSVTITVVEKKKAEVTLKGLTCGDFSTEGGGDVEITLNAETKNVLEASYLRAGLEKKNSGSLKILGRGSLSATGGYQGAGIGGEKYLDVENITISGNAEVTAIGGIGGAGIGGGPDAGGRNITISENARVTAIGGTGGAGIGGGSRAGGKID